jgi:outer membrane protein assembly factor BamB
MDSTGHIVWTRVPNVDGGISIYNTQSFLIDGKLYGFNNGNGAYFTFEMDAHSGNILWVKNPAADILATANLKSPFIDSNQIYIFSDAFELFGQSLVDGSLSLFTPLLWYTSNIDIPLDPYIVRGRRVYYQTENEIMCIERK